MEIITLDVPAMYGDHHVVEVRRILLEISGVGVCGKMDGGGLPHSLVYPEQFQRPVYGCPARQRPVILPASSGLEIQHITRRIPGPLQTRRPGRHNDHPFGS